MAQRERREEGRAYGDGKARVGHYPLLEEVRVKHKVHAPRDVLPHEQLVHHSASIIERRDHLLVNLVLIFLVFVPFFKRQWVDLVAVILTWRHGLQHVASHFEDWFELEGSGHIATDFELAQHHQLHVRGVPTERAKPRLLAIIINMRVYTLVRRMVGHAHRSALPRLCRRLSPHAARHDFHRENGRLFLRPLFGLRAGHDPRALV
mmetsp:Transcript_58694/g.162454  ORF Transcript_58694/g.162454 Transcript_58694/m.162454 type:complete len:206 (-) Transcript_58694:139-756(-)